MMREVRVNPVCLEMMREVRAFQKKHENPLHQLLCHGWMPGPSKVGAQVDEVDSNVIPNSHCHREKEKECVLLASVEFSCGRICAKNCRRLGVGNKWHYLTAHDLGYRILGDRKRCVRERTRRHLFEGEFSLHLVCFCFAWLPVLSLRINHDLYELNIWKTCTWSL